MQYFIDRGREENIIPFIIEGEPYTQSEGVECLPLPLKLLSEAHELLGININEYGIEQAFIKVVSRLFDLTFDSLWNRFKKREWVKMEQLATTTMLLSSYLIKDYDSIKAQQLLVELFPKQLTNVDKPILKGMEFQFRKSLNSNSCQLRGHSAKVNSASFSFDGNKVITSSDDKTVKVWDSITGELIRSFIHNTVVNDAIIAHNGNIVAAATDNNIILWDISTGEKKVLTHSALYIASMAFNDDDTILFSSTGDFVMIWDIIKGKCVKTIKGFRNIYCLYYFKNKLLLLSRDIYILNSTTGEKIVKIKNASFADVSPTGELLAFADNSDSSHIYLYNILKKKIVKTIIAHDNEIQGVAYSPSGRTIASVSADGTVLVFDSATGKELQKINIDRKTGSIMFGPDDNIVVTLSKSSDNDDLVCIFWDIYSGGILHQMKGCSAFVPHDFLFSPDGKFLHHCETDSSVAIVDVYAVNMCSHFKGLSDGFIQFSSDGKYIAGRDKISTSYMRIWLKETGESYRTFLLGTDYRTKFLFCPGTHILAVVDLHSIKIIDIHAQCINTLVKYAHFYGIDIAFSQNGNLFCDCTENEIHIWEVASGSLIKSIQIQSDDYIQEIRFSNDTDIIVIEDGNFNIGLVDIVSSKITFSINSTSYTLSKNYILFGQRNGKIDLYSFKEQTVVSTFIGHEHWITAVAFSNDEKYILSASKDYTIRMWDCNTSSEIHCYQIQSVAEDVLFSLDQKYIVALLRSHSCIIINIKTDEIVNELNDIESVAISPTGDIVIVSTNGSINVLVLPELQQLLDEANSKFTSNGAGRNPYGNELLRHLQ